MVAKSKKIKVEDIKEDPIEYEEVIKEVDTPPNEPQQSSSSAGTEPDTPAPIKEKEKGTCEGCGKTMTMKNLKYSHKFTCQALRKPVQDVEDLPEEEEVADESPPPPPPKQSLRRVHSTYEAEPVPQKIVKEKRPQSRSPKPYEFQPTPEALPIQPRMTKAMMKAEKYHSMASKALP
jgi:hypothetical protein